MSKRLDVDWGEARRLHEQDGLPFSEIARRFDLNPHTVGDHAQREGWVDLQQLLRDGAAERREKALQAFIRRDVAAIERALMRERAIADKLLDLAEMHTDRLLEQRALMIRKGTDKHGAPIYVEEDPVTAWRSVTLGFRAVHEVNFALAGLHDESWRPAPVAETQHNALPSRKDIRKMLAARASSSDEQTEAAA